MYSFVLQLIKASPISFISNLIKTIKINHNIIKEPVALQLLVDSFTFSKFSVSFSVKMR